MMFGEFDRTAGTLVQNIKDKAVLPKSMWPKHLKEVRKKLRCGRKL